MSSNFSGIRLRMVLGLASRARWARLLLSVLAALVPLGLALVASLAGRPGTALAGGTVGGACTEADLDAALAGGGVVTFNCGGPLTITLTSEKLIAVTTTINGPLGGPTA